MKNTVYFSLFLVMVLALASCAPEPSCETISEQYGILNGLLHGFVFPFAVIGKLIGMDFGLYAVNNTGTLYWLGYFIGILVWIGGATRL